MIKILNGGTLADVVVWIITLIGNLLLAIVVVVAFARKRDTQPILSIEDFWGGLFIGAMTGYTGKSALNQILPKTTGGSGST